MQASSGSRVPSEDGASGLGPSCAPQVPFDLSVAPSHAATVSEQLVDVEGAPSMPSRACRRSARGAKDDSCQRGIRTYPCPCPTPHPVPVLLLPSEQRPVLLPSLHPEVVHRIAAAAVRSHHFTSHQRRRRRDDALPLTENPPHYTLPGPAMTPNLVYILNDDTDVLLGSASTL